MDIVGGVVVDGGRETQVHQDGTTSTHWAHGDTLFATSERRASVSQHSVWAIDVTTAQLRWSASHGRINVPPALSPLHADRLYVATRAGELKALRKSDGAELWSLDTGVQFLNAMAVSRTSADQRIALVDFRGRIWMARDNGFSAEWLWQAELPIGPVPVGTSTIPDLAAVGTPVIDEPGKLYVGAANGTIDQLDEDTGAFEASRTVAADPSALVTEMTLHSTDAGITIVLVSATFDGQVAKHDIPFCQPGGVSTTMPMAMAWSILTTAVRSCPMRTRRMLMETVWPMLGRPIQHPGASVCCRRECDRLECDRAPNRLDSRPVARRQVTRQIHAWNEGDLDAREHVMTLVYEELHRRAATHMRRERQGHLLQPTALVHEAYLRLVDQRQTAWRSRAQFLAVAAEIMRRILVDWARAHRTSKRSGQWSRVSLDPVAARPGNHTTSICSIWTRR